MFVHHGCSGPVWGGALTVRRMRAFAVEKMRGSGGRVGGGASCFRQFVSGLVAWYALVAWNPGKCGGASPVALSLANRLGVVFAALNSPK